MTIGAVVGYPTTKFALPRSYIKRLMFPARLALAGSVAGVFIFTEPLYPAHTYYVVVKPNFWVWSSNKWTLDFIVDQAYATINPSPTLIPASVFITYKAPVDSTGAALAIDLFIVEGAYFSVDLPSGTGDYWLPDS